MTKEEIFYLLCVKKSRMTYTRGKCFVVRIFSTKYVKNKIHQFKVETARAHLA